MAKLGVLFAFLLEISCIVMTTTASQADMNGITDSLVLKNCKYIVGNPDRKNISYEKVFRHGDLFLLNPFGCPSPKLC